LVGVVVRAGIIGGVTPPPDGPRRLRALLDGSGPTPIAASFDDQVTDDVLLQAVADGMDVAEVRIDRFASTEPADVVEQVLRIGAVSGVPTLATIRSAAEGGRWKGSEQERAELFVAAVAVADGVDVELLAVDVVEVVVALAHASGVVLVGSMHDFEGTPALDELEVVVVAGRAAGVEMVKVATTANTAADLAVLEQLTERHQADGVIVLGMGELGAESRVRLPGLGSRLAFALAPGQEAVSGQMTVAETAARLRTT